MKFVINLSVLLFVYLLTLKFNELKSQESFNNYQNVSLFSNLPATDSIVSDKNSNQYYTGWENGTIPEGSNAYTLKRHVFRLNLVGRTSFGITDKLEISTYLPLIIFPDLSFKYRFIDHEKFAMAYQIMLGAGLYPCVGGGLLPGPGFIVAGGVLGFFTGSVQALVFHATFHPVKNFTYSFQIGQIEAEGAFVGIGAVVAAGGGGAGGAIIPVAIGRVKSGYTGGLETGFCLNQKNNILFKANIIGFYKAKTEFLLSSAGWTHAWDHIHLTLGLYTILDPPQWKMVTDSKEPVGPMLQYLLVVE